VSEPYVYTNREMPDDLAAKILERITAKAKIRYPANTSLIIQCFQDALFLEDEWEYSIEKTKESGIQYPFREIFVFDSNHHYAATLYGKNQRRRKQ